MGNDLYYKVYPHRDPICVSHYPNPVHEIIPEKMIDSFGLTGMPPKNNVGAVYVHVPFCAQVCVFCPFNKVAYQKNDVLQYMDAVKKEIDIYSSTNYIKNTQIDSVYFGGGTPSALSSEQMAELLRVIHEKYNILPGAQISFEGSPSTLNTEKYNAIRKEGANRISIGVQTFNEKMAGYLKLSHKPDHAIEVIQQAYEAGFKNVGIDLMYNLPEQTMEEWLEDVRKAIALDIKNITLFSLCVVPFTPFFQMIKDGVVPPIGNENYEVDMYLEARELLEKAGYVQYSVWDFAKPEYIDKHVILYYTKQRDLISHGPAAFGYINRLMYINQGDLKEYLKRIESGFTSVFIGQKAEDTEAMHGMMAKGLRMISVKREDFKELFHCQPEDHFGEKIDELVEKGLLEVNENEVRLTKRGIVWGNNVCKEFFSAANQQSFESRVHLARGQKPKE